MLRDARRIRELGLRVEIPDRTLVRSWQRCCSQSSIMAILCTYNPFVEKFVTI